MNNCKIYKVYSLQDNKYYIGSTKQDIHRRMLAHKSKNNNRINHYIDLLYTFRIKSKNT